MKEYCAHLVSPFLNSMFLLNKKTGKLEFCWLGAFPGGVLHHCLQTSLFTPLKIPFGEKIQM